MAIFGNVTDMPLPDVLTMVGRSTGRFIVSQTSCGHAYELHLDRGMLIALIVDQEPIGDIFQVHNRMVELMNLHAGDFEFEKQEVSSLMLQFNLSIEMLLLSSLAALDELEAYRSRLPNNQTIFQILPSKEAWLEGDLLEFWECSYNLLAEGTSAEKIAERTSLFIDHVLLCLYKLRTAGIIAPVRAFSPRISGGLNGGRIAIPPAATARLPEMGTHQKSEPQGRHPEASTPFSSPLLPDSSAIQKILLRLRESLQGQSE